MDRRPLLPLFALIALLAGAPAVAAAAAPAAGEPVVSLRLHRPGAEHPSAWAGILSAPSNRAPAQVARAWLDSRPALLRELAPERLRLAQVSSLRDGGAVVRFAQTHEGLEVVGPSVVVRTDALGRVRWSRVRSAPVAAGLPVTPALSAEAAVAVVRAGPAAHQGPIDLDAGRQTQLVVWAPAGQEARLAWRVIVPRNVLTLETLRIYVDALTGQVLTVENLVRMAKQANVYEDNPVSTPDPVVRELALPDGSTSLSGPDVLVHNCIDRGNCRPFQTPYGEMMIHFCDTEPVATADSAGDFLQYLRPADDAAAEDEFAEVQMYHHVTRAYAAFRAWGFDRLDAWPLTALVNLRMPPMDMNGICTGTTSTGPLEPFDNAAFMPAGALGGFPADDQIVFGQGVTIDYAYDGDVVYHEFTHAAMAGLTPLGMVAPDSFGLDTTPGGLHEGYADYFSSAIAGDPEQGEYAGSGFADNPLPSGAIRSLENDKRCPQDLVGESHADSEPWSGGLWDVRQALLAAGHPEGDIDAALFAVLGGLGEMDSFFDAYVATVSEVTTALGTDAGDVAAAHLEARGLAGCNDRVIPTALGDTKEMLFLNGNDRVGASPVPGPVQFALSLDEASNEIKLHIGASAAAGYGGSSPAIRLLVKPGDEPIVWNWSGSSATHDAPFDVPVTFSGGVGVGEASVEWVEGTVTQSFPAGPYHLQLVNAGGSLVAYDVGFSSVPAPPVDPPDAGPGDAGTLPGDGGETADGGSEAGGGGAAGGCGCSSAGGASAAGWALLLLGLAVARRRRFPV